MSKSWDKINDKKLRELNKGNDKHERYLDNFDVEKRIEILKEKVLEEPAGYWCTYHVEELVTGAEEVGQWFKVIFGRDISYYWQRSRSVKKYLLEAIEHDLRQNNIIHEIDYHCRVIKILLPREVSK